MRRISLAVIALAFACRRHEDFPTAEQYPNAVPELAVVMSKNEPSVVCSPLGVVEGKGNDPRVGYDRMRTQAALRGANYVVIDGTTAGTINAVAKVIGRAFRCPPPSANEAPASNNDSRGASACVPDCSPGYVCVEAKCVSACNPSCASDERCSADRTCHSK